MIFVWRFSKNFLVSLKSRPFSLIVLAKPTIVIYYIKIIFLQRCLRLRKGDFFTSTVVNVMKNRFKHFLGFIYLLFAYFPFKCIAIFFLSIKFSRVLMQSKIKPIFFPKLDKKKLFYIFLSKSKHFQEPQNFSQPSTISKKGSDRKKKDMWFIRKHIN